MPQALARIDEMRATAEHLGVTRQLLDTLVAVADKDTPVAMELLHTVLARLGVDVIDQLAYLHNSTNGRHGC